MKGFQRHLELWWHHVEWKERPQLGVYMPPWGLNSTTSDIPSDTPRQLGFTPSNLHCRGVGGAEL